MADPVRIKAFSSATAVRIEIPYGGYPIRETLKARGYRFSNATGDAIWSKTIPRTDLDACKAEAGWVSEMRSKGAMVTTEVER